jgi:translocator protein
LKLLLAKRPSKPKLPKSFAGSIRLVKVKIMQLVTRSELRWALVRAMAVITTLVVLFAAVVSKFGAAGRSAWFATLQKPKGMLSPEAFTLWWALIFLLLGLTLAIIWQARGAKQRRWALTALLPLLCLALLWLPLIFGLRQLAIGAIMAVAMIFIASMATYFSFRVRKLAGILMLLVTGWIIFCGYAAVRLWHINGMMPLAIPTDLPNMAGSNTSFIQ